MTRLQKRGWLDEFIAEIAGDAGVPITKILKGRGRVSETELAKSLKKDINETRNLLYQLHHNNIVAFSKKKEGKKGWYNYYWSFNKKQLRPLFVGSRRQQLSAIGRGLERERGSCFFMCQNGCMRFEFSSAMEMVFKCPECGGLLNQYDNCEHIRRLEEDMKRITAQIKEVEA